VQFKRLVARVQRQYQKRGINMRKNKIERNLAEKLVRDIINEKAVDNEVRSLNQNTARQAHFDKEYKKLK